MSVCMLLWLLCTLQVREGGPGGDAHEGVPQVGISAGQQGACPARQGGGDRTQPELQF